MTDRELLELAAKAADIIAMPIYGGGDALYTAAMDEWNPLTDDGDALRLAVKLNLTVESWSERAFVRACSCCTRTDIHTVKENHGDDPYAATRRAIVKAAAEIGKGMK